MEHTDGCGVDLLIDFVGKDYWHPNIDSLAKDGRIVLVGFLSGKNHTIRYLHIYYTLDKTNRVNLLRTLGRIVENFDLSALLMKRLRVRMSFVIPWL